jgi:Cu(I)/Ag(I) efflux system membrane fusion protein
VYEGEETQGPEVKISLDKVQKLGVKTEQAGMRTLSRTVRAVGTFDVDERAKRTVAPRFEGWIERLYVDATGQLVQRGQPLMDVYSPDLITAQQEYLVAARGVAALKDASPEMQASMRALVEGSIQRLSNWEIGEQELARLRAEGKPRNTMTLRSPASGVVLEKPAVQGMRFMPGETLYRIADLSTLWLLADVFEQDLGLIRPGQAARITVSAFPGKVFEGKVAFIYPTVTPETRTAKLRIEMRNPERLLKPEMYASVELETTQAGAKHLAVADSAVLDSGTRQIVLVRRGEGLFEPREVKLGARGDGYVEVMDGVKAGEEVVVSANFLIDAESNLKAAIAGFGAASPARQAKPAAGAAKTHAAAGTVESVDTKAGSVSISHGPVASLKWPGMTMDFKVRDRALLQTMRAGARINFEFAEPVPGEWTVIGITPAPGAPAAHKGH